MKVGVTIGKVSDVADIFLFSKMADSIRELNPPVILYSK
jgi:hypothetical protein